MKVLLAALSLSLMLSGAALAGKPMSTTVEIHNFRFNPQKITIHAGSSVTWINRDEGPHTVADAKKAWRSAALDTGDKYSHTFTAPGSYSYFCTMHPQMTGTIDVVP